MKPFNSFREFLELLERKNEINNVKKEVDKDWEISTVTRKTWIDFKGNSRPCLIFDKVKNYQIPVALGVYATQRRVAYSLGIFEADPRKEWEKTRDCFVQAEENRCKPALIQTGPCQENVLLDDEVDITSLLPVPIWTPGKDVGPYITAGGTVSKDPRTGEINVGIHRLQVKGPRKLGIYPSPGADLFFHLKNSASAQKPLPVAVIIGNAPIIHYPSFYKVPYCEYDLAGGFQGAPLEVVKAKSVDIEVPACTEIVLEGYIPPDHLEEEGPWGEAFGVVCPRRMNPIIEITAATYRNNPVFHAFMSSGVPGTASSTRAAVKPFWVYNTLKRSGVPEVHDIFMPEAATGSQILIVSIKKQWAFHPRHVMYAVWGSKNNYDCKFILVTDSDVNIRDGFDLMKAIFMRVEPSKDVVFLHEGGSHAVDPNAVTEETTAKMGIDATMPYDFDLSVPSDEYFENVTSMWKEYGISEIKKT